MTLNEAIETLEEHNKWRRSESRCMGSPQKIGEAIDICLSALRKPTKNKANK